jgi:hypothetical protein
MEGGSMRKSGRKKRKKRPFGMLLVVGENMEIVTMLREMALSPVLTGILVLSVPQRETRSGASTHASSVWAFSHGGEARKVVAVVTSPIRKLDPLEPLQRV